MELSEYVMLIFICHKIIKLVLPTFILDSRCDKIVQIKYLRLIFYSLLNRYHHSCINFFIYIINHSLI